MPKGMLNCSNFSRFEIFAALILMIQIFWDFKLSSRIINQLGN